MPKSDNIYVYIYIKLMAPPINVNTSTEFPRAVGASEEV